MKRTPCEIEVSSLLLENDRQHRELLKLREQLCVSRDKIEIARHLIKSHRRHQLSDAETTLKAIDRALEGEGL